MASSSAKVQVWNRALMRIGQTDVIEDEDEDRLAAAVCRLHWDDVVGEALELRDWDFAKRQAVLALAPAGTARSGWDYAYQLPADCVAPRGLVRAGLRAGLEPGAGRAAFEVQASEDGGLLLLTDDEVDGVTLEYTASGGSLASWPRLFVSAVAWRLAAELALAVVKGLEGQRLAVYALQAFEAAVAVAHARRLNAVGPDDELDSPSILARL